MSFVLLAQLHVHQYRKLWKKDQLIVALPKPFFKYPCNRMGYSVTFFSIVPDQLPLSLVCCIYRLGSILITSNCVRLGWKRSRAITAHRKDFATRMTLNRITVFLQTTVTLLAYISARIRVVPLFPPTGSLPKPLCHSFSSRL